MGTPSHVDEPASPGPTAQTAQVAPEPSAMEAVRLAMLRIQSVLERSRAQQDASDTPDSRDARPAPAASEGFRDPALPSPPRDVSAAADGTAAAATADQSLSVCSQDILGREHKDAVQYVPPADPVFLPLPACSPVGSPVAGRDSRGPHNHEVDLDLNVLQSSPPGGRRRTSDWERFAVETLRETLEEDDTDSIANLILDLRGTERFVDSMLLKSVFPPSDGAAMYQLSQTHSPGSIGRYESQILPEGGASDRSVLHRSAPARGMHAAPAPTLAPAQPATEAGAAEHPRGHNRYIRQYRNAQGEAIAEKAVTLQPDTALSRRMQPAVLTVTNVVHTRGNEVSGVVSVNQQRRIVEGVRMTRSPPKRSL